VSDTKPVSERPEVLLMLVGTSPEPLIISIGKLRPERVHFICTTDSEKYIDRVVSESKLVPSQTDKTVMTGLETQETYGAVKDLRGRYSGKVMALDITGGKKAMVAGATLAGFLLDLPVYYVDFREFDPEKRRPKPGSEFLARLPNPYSVFGSVEEAHADSLFAAGDYRAAELLYGALCRRVPDPRCCEVKRLVSAAYVAWDDFAFAQAHGLLTSAVEKARQYGCYDTQQMAWARQLELLGHLKDDARDRYYELLKGNDYFESAAVSLVVKAERWLGAGQAGTASVCCYRLLELMVQHRLMKHGIKANDVPKGVRNTYDEDFRKLHKALLDSEAAVPSRLGLFHGMMLLHLMKDELVKHERDHDYLSGLRRQLDTRNDLWMEHKNATVSSEEGRRFINYVYSWLRRLLPDYECRVDAVKVMGLSPWS